MTMSTFRPAVRGLVLDSDNCVLLVKLVFPNGSWWVLPGGGIDAGESHVDALHRGLQCHEHDPSESRRPPDPVYCGHASEASMRIARFRKTDGQGLRIQSKL